MLHAEFQDHRTSGSGEDFLRFLPYMGMAAIFGHVTSTIYINLLSPFLRRLRIKFGFDWPAVSEKMFENQSRTNGPINAHLTIAQVMPRYNHNNEKQEVLL